MTLEQIRARIAKAREDLKAINPRIKTTMVVILGNHRLPPDKVDSGNAELLEMEDILLDWPGRRDLERCIRERAELEELHGETKREMEGDTRGIHTRSRTRLMKDRLRTIERQLQAKRRDVLAILPVAEFAEPSIELRFASLDMEEIQRIKNHPIIQSVGRTDLSPSSIGVVIG